MSRAPLEPVSGALREARRGAGRALSELQRDAGGHTTPSTGSHFGWAFVRGRKVIPVNVSGQLMVNEAGPLLAACLGGQGIAQMLELYARELLADGRLIQVLPEWAEETYPLYAYYHSARVQSTKVRAFLDFVVALTRRPPP